AMRHCSARPPGAHVGPYCAAPAGRPLSILFFFKQKTAYELLGKKLDKGALPYQDFALMVRLRDRLVHFKGNEGFDPKATAQEFHKDLIRRFGKSNLLAEDMEPGSWMRAIETKAIANSSCSTAARVVVELVSK